MPIIVFLIIAFVGLYTTRRILRTIMHYGKYTSQVGALVVAFGFSLTFFFSGIAPVAVANNFEIDIYFFIIIFFVSIVIWISSYLTFLFIFRKL